MSVAGVAKELNISEKTLKNRVKASGFPIRTKSEAMQLVKRQGRLNLAKRGSQNPGWKSGVIEDGQGYVKMWTPDGYIRRGRLVWEQSRGRKLPEGWVVHHVNGNKQDDRPENVVAYPKLKHLELIPRLLSTINILKLENENLKKEQPALIEHSEEDLVGV